MIFKRLISVIAFFLFLSLLVVFVYYALFYSVKKTVLEKKIDTLVLPLIDKDLKRRLGSQIEYFETPTSYVFRKWKKKKNHMVQILKWCSPFSSEVLPSSKDSSPH